jgi:hypothetical protein
MRILLSLLLLPGLAYANPGVTKNTDIGRNKVKRHHQVTWTCEDSTGTCSTARFEEFENPMKDERYRQICDVVVRDNRRYMSCTTTKATASNTEDGSQNNKGTSKDTGVATARTWKPSGPNRLSLHVGWGPTGLEYDEKGEYTKVKEDMNLVLGVGYSRVVYKNMSLGVSIYTNKTMTGTVGFDF